MLRSHKKSHYRHLLFKCANCSFESKQYQALQEHLQIEGHEAFIDENIEEFLKEYASGSMTTSSGSQQYISTTVALPIDVVRINDNGEEQHASTAIEET